jgi:glycosyltransferase involved in cell wall biosynthesis
MRIAIDCRTILNPGYGESAGIGHYVYFLVKNLLRLDRRNEYRLFFDRRLSKEAADSFIGGAKNARPVFLPLANYKKYLPIAYSHFLVAAAFFREKPDLTHFPAGSSPLALNLPTVVTVHDLTIYSHPEWFPKQELSVKVSYPRTVKAARRLIAVSQATKRDLQQVFGLSGRKISVIYPGVEVSGSGIYEEDIFDEDDAVDFADLTKRYKLRKPYFLFLGTLEPRKNVKYLCEAFARAWKKSAIVREMELLIAGRPGWSDGGAVAAIKKTARLSGGAVRSLGYVAHRDKFPLMRAARVFVFPSLAEGFGMPVAEALSLGVPTVVSDIPVFHEVAGRAALYTDPLKPEEMTGVLIKAVSDERAHLRLAKAGPRQAKRFSWEKAARETLAVYRQAVKK